MNRTLAQQLLAAGDRAGRRLGAPARLVLFSLWSEVDPIAALRYVHREGGAVAPLLVIGKRRLVDVLDLDTQTLDRHLRTLIAAAWIGRLATSGQGQLHLRLVDAIDRQHLIASRSGGLSSRSEESDLLSFDRDLLSEMRGDPISSDRKISVPTSTLNVNVNTPQPPHGRAGALSEHEATAIEILSAAIRPTGFPAIPATRHGARHLTRRLEEGWPAAEARRLVQAMPRIVARGLRDEALEHYVAGAFDGERFDRWLAALAKLDQLEAAEQRRDAARPAPTPQRAGPVATTEHLAAMGAGFGGPT